jgi:hypothetical protein
VVDGDRPGEHRVEERLPRVGELLRLQDPRLTRPWRHAQRRGDLRERDLLRAHVRRPARIRVLIHQRLHLSDHLVRHPRPQFRLDTCDVRREPLQLLQDRDRLVR